MAPTVATNSQQVGRISRLDREIATGARWWSVTLVLADGGSGAIAGVPAVEWWRTREEAREGYGARLVALRDAGWQRVA